MPQVGLGLLDDDVAPAMECLDRIDFLTGTVVASRSASREIIQEGPTVKAVRGPIRLVASLLVLSVVALVISLFSAFGTRAAAPDVPAELRSIYFSPGATRLQPRDFRILDEHLRWLLGDSRRVIVVEGHTDEPSNSSFSQEVGAQRAEAVKAYLVSNGVPADRITTVSRGGGQPVCQERTASCRALNRRTSFLSAVRP